VRTSVGSERGLVADQLAFHSFPQGAKFRKMGFIDYNGELHVHSSLLNVVLHD
jgi:hypothetical protein